MKPQQLIIFGALGVGVYLFMTRKAMAGGTRAPAWSQSPVRAIAPGGQVPTPTDNLTNAAATALQSLFGSKSANVATPGINADAYAVNSPMAYAVEQDWQSAATDAWGQYGI